MTLQSELDYKPLKITFNFATPVIMSFPWINFDGLLNHFVLRLMIDQDYYLLESDNPIQNITDNLPLPIAKLDKLYLTSVFLFKNSNNERFDLTTETKTTTIYKRFEERYIHDLKTKTKKIDIARGIFKNYAMRMPLIPSKTADVYCIAKPQSLALLLQFLYALGKKTAYGYGQIKTIQIDEQIDTNYSIWNNLTQEALRPIPIRFCESYTTFNYIATKSPFWDKRNIEQCVPIFAKCFLKKYLYTNLEIL